MIYKVSSLRTQHIGPVESRASGHSDTTLGYIGDLQLKLFNLWEVPREIYTTWLGQNPEEALTYKRLRNNIFSQNPK